MPILNFKGKSVIQNHHHTVKFHELDPVKAKGTSKTPSLDDNLIIHGDNLRALKALLPTYAGKVQCIYIDPPYNTGNEHWVYNDNVNSPMIKEWLGKEVIRDDLTRHDKWCCMMFPRLTLLRELLSEKGVIFVSIDDNEVQHLRLLMDEIFGEENFIASVIWQKRISPDARLGLGAAHDYILVYAKSAEHLKFNKLPMSVRQTESFKNPDNDPRGAWVSTDFTAQGFRPNQMYKITTPAGVTYEPPTGRCWANIEEEFERLRSDGRIWFGKDGRSRPRIKTYENETEGISAWTWWSNSEVGDNQESKREVIEILGSENTFDTPKPVKLLQRILQLSTDKNSIILDSFAGSGTTAHAVLALNAEDKGNRKFILVECEEYADKLTAERVRRVAKGIKDANDESLQKGLGGSFSFYELGDPIDIDAMLDGKKLPTFENLAHYAFYTATGESFDPSKAKEKDFYIGSSTGYELFMLYAPNADKLRELALNLEFVETIEKKFPKKPKLVFAPACYLEEYDLRDRNIRFAQLPFEIYRLAD